jgi:hypothetical protein
VFEGFMNLAALAANCAIQKLTLKINRWRWNTLLKVFLKISHIV